MVKISASLSYFNYKGKLADINAEKLTKLLAEHGNGVIEKINDVPGRIDLKVILETNNIKNIIQDLDEQGWLDGATLEYKAKGLPSYFINIQVPEGFSAAITQGDAIRSTTVSRDESTDIATPDRLEIEYKKNLELI